MFSAEISGMVAGEDDHGLRLPDQRQRGADRRHRCRRPAAGRRSRLPREARRRCPGPERRSRRPGRRRPRGRRGSARRPSAGRRRGAASWAARAHAGACAGRHDEDQRGAHRRIVVVDGEDGAPLRLLGFRHQRAPSLSVGGAKTGRRALQGAPPPPRELAQRSSCLRTAPEASRSRTQGAKRALHVSDRGRGDAQLQPQARERSLPTSATETGSSRRRSGRCRRGGRSPSRRSWGTWRGRGCRSAGRRCR